MNTRVPTLVVAAITAISLGAQSPNAGLDSLRTPIHSLDADYGVMAAGRTYKARFDGGFTYIPVLGAAYEDNLEFEWRTTSVRVGASELLSGAAVERRVGDFRFEYDFGRVVEAYDVLLDGVEQTFVLPKRPVATGDLVVVGEVAGKLTGDVTERAHTSIVFRGPAGERIVDYGAAIAVDADGERFRMTSSFDGTHLELRLDAACLEQAAFPLVVDPLIGSDPVRNGGMTAVAAVPQPGVSAPNGISVYTRITSASDHDAFGVLTRPGFQVVALAFGDISTSYSSEKVAAGSYDGWGKILIAAERRQGTTTRLECYIHDVTSAAYRSGTSLILGSTGEEYRNPAVGGSKDTNAALVVYDYKPNGSTSKTIRGHRVFETGVNIPLANTIAAQSAFNHEREPSITPYARNIEGWVVAWAASHVGSGEIFCRKVYETGAHEPVVQIIQPASNFIYSNVKLAGGNGRFVAIYNATPTGIGFVSTRLRRFDWPQGGSLVQKDNRFLTSGSATGGGIAHDFETKSHWIAVYSINTGALSSEVRAHRLGYQGAIVDTTVIHQSGTPKSPSIAFNGRPGNALYDILFYELNSTDNAVIGESYEYPMEVYLKPRYSSGCGAAEMDNSDPTLSGSEFFTSRLVAHDGQPAALFFSRLAATYPLDVIGMTGCVLAVEPSLVISYPATLNTAGEFQVTFPIPDDPLFASSFYTQWVWTSIGANPLGVVVNGAVAHQAM